ncbi:hypothetical protein MNBD_ALPHA01-1899 [hydrothermal vent metagenome]|uniref:Uncharacterized protein n=1 Tax=hydrothermal vent metagenome TaxID=652676 RepID=A0A3B0T3I6_9ZZZZ
MNVKSIYPRLSKLLNNNMLFVKALIIASMAVVVMFVDKDNSWCHWTRIAYFSLTVILLLIAVFENRANKLSPLDKVKKYLLDFEEWVQTSTDDYTDYYESAPEFIVRTNDEDNNLDFDQEWTRGEIGAHYKNSNGAYYREICYHGTLLKQIHIVFFDGGKKTVVSPNWESICQGRIYYYLKDSIEYAYQNYLILQHGTDYSIDIRKSGVGGNFDIPVFKDEQELERFMQFCATSQSATPESDRKRQNTLFYDLLDKYEDFRKQSSGRKIKKDKN